MRLARTSVAALGAGLTFLAAGTLAATTPSTTAAASPRTVVSFDPDWRFLKGDAPGAEKPDFDDKGWRPLSVPHDWSIEGPFDENAPTTGSGGFLPAGVGWYRKRFSLPAPDASRRVFIDFDGVMANSDVWINGEPLGKRPYGYSSFRYELTGHLHFGSQPNILAVRADNSEQPASRWYTGAGIYRHVRLVVADPIHFDHWGNFVTTPQITDDRATVQIQSSLINQSEKQGRVSVQVTLLDPLGKAVATVDSSPQSIAAGKSETFTTEIPVPHPQRWDIDHAFLYRALVRVRRDKTTLDEESVPFGIRAFRFEPATGFWLNGRNFKIKGVCLHHEAGALGAAVPLRAWERRLELLKQVGVNAIRTAHNPPAPEFLDLCDRMGLLVMDEAFDAWTVGKRPYDYHLYFHDWSPVDTRDMVLRDRNHPSIILYNAGNEIRDTPNAAQAKQTLSSLLAVFHQYDPTRPVTQALFRPNASHDYDDGLADLLDVVGQNYRENEILAAHQAKPERRIVGTENGHDRATWLALRDNAPYAGQFLWTGFDYLGESRGWPTVGAGAGLFDRTGMPRPLAFQRQSWWSETPMVRIVRRTGASRATPADPCFAPLARRQTTFADWSPSDTTPHDENVEVYSNAEQVELFLNDHSLGTLPRPADDSPRTWTIPFAAGTLRAVARNGGKEVATDTLRTAGKPAKIVLSVDHDTLAANWDDIAYVTATIVDADGVTVPDADAPITFKLTGPGIIAAVDSGDNASHEPFLATQRRTFQGRCVALIKAASAGGDITLTASAPDLTESSLILHTEN